MAAPNSNLKWMLPVLVVGLCAVVFPCWALGVPGEGGSTYATGWTLGLFVIVGYPIVTIGLFGLGKALGEVDNERACIVMAHLALAVAPLTMVIAWLLLSGQFA